MHNLAHETPGARCLNCTRHARVVIEATVSGESALLSRFNYIAGSIGVQKSTSSS